MKPVTDPAILSQLDAQAGPKEVTDPAILAQLEGAPVSHAPARPQLDQYGVAPSIETDPTFHAPTGKELALGAEQGVANFLNNAGSIPDKVVHFFGGPEHAIMDAVGGPMRPEDAPDMKGVQPNAGARFLTNVGLSVPLTAVAPFEGPGVLPAIGNGAVQGGLAGNLTGDGSASSTAGGAALGGTLAGLTHGLAALMTPNIRPAVQNLSQNGVQMTPGQIFGGTAKGVEDRLAGFPIAGDPIKEAQRESLRTFGTGAGDIALAPLGDTGRVPAGISGQAMAQHADQVFDDAYGQLLPQMQITLGEPLSNAVNAAGDRVAARLPNEYAGQFQGTLADVFKKMGAGDGGPMNSFPGQAVKDAYSDLGTQARAYTAPNAMPNDRALGRAFGDVQEGLRNSFAASDPWGAGALQNIDAAYRGFIPVNTAVARASGNGSGLEAGVFTPSQLRRAVVSGDRSVRNMAVAQGGGPLQQYAENGIQVLPSSVPDSGTAGRLGLAELLLHPQMIPPALATRAVYNRPVLGAINRAYGNGPSVGAQQLADLFRTLGRNAPAPLVASRQGSGK